MQILDNKPLVYGLVNLLGFIYIYIRVALKIKGQISSSLANQFGEHTADALSRTVPLFKAGT